MEYQDTLCMKNRMIKDKDIFVKGVFGQTLNLAEKLWIVTQEKILCVA